MIDYELKSKVLETRFPYFVKQISKQHYIINSIHDKIDNQGFYTSTDMKKIKDCYEKIDYYKNEITTNAFCKGVSCEDVDKYIREAEKINHASYVRVKRIKDKISSMLNNSCLFLTFTIDRRRVSISSKTFKRYVVEHLSSLHCHYVANVDYGEKGGLEHYHAVVQLDYLSNEKFCFWKYGTLKIDKIVNPDSDIKLAKYLTKLTNHAIKHTTKSNRVIFDKLKD